MNNVVKSLAWAGMIIAAAMIAKQSGMADTESTFLTMGLVAAAMATIRPAKGCC